jgi:hypothetical protein
MLHLYGGIETLIWIVWDQEQQRMMTGGGLIAIVASSRLAER